MNRVWRTRGRAGPRLPAAAARRRRGGNGRFDVYLKDVGVEGLYGYCAPERREPGHAWLASGYCVLDDDFARGQFGATPEVSLRVTAAHEFFHAVQFAYDYGEDRWLMEATATWMEERVADDVDDNRQYLPYGQLARPGSSLDIFDPQGFNQYGNWAFFEYLADRFGDDVVRAVWRQAGAYDGAPDRYSVPRSAGSSPGTAGWPRRFRRTPSAATAPAHFFDEGASWPGTTARPRRLGARDRPGLATLRINHLAARPVDVRPAASLRSRRWRLQITVHAPPAKTGPGGVPAGVAARRLPERPPRSPLDADGVGRQRVRFDSRRVRRVTITLANASTRYRCGRGGPTFALRGSTPRPAAPLRRRRPGGPALGS